MGSVSNTDTKSRTKKTLLNARVNLIFYFLTLVLSFFSRKIFLDCLGAEFIGLTGTLQNMLGFLNLAELGIGSAIGYVLYKPLYDRDEKKICEIISVMGYLYRWIGLIILAGGCILACFLPLIFPDTGFSLPLIYFAYFSFLASSLIGYFINYRQNLLSADQRNYVVTGYYKTIIILKTIIQMALAYYTKSYYCWVAIELSFGIIYSLILNWKINKIYPWLKTEIDRGKSLLKSYEVVKVKTKQLFIHQISSFTQYQTISFLIYAFVNLEKVTCYGNYSMIFDNIGRLIDYACGGVLASVGNLISEGNNNKIQNVFWEFFSFRVFTTGIVIFGVLNFINPFISLWVGEQYLLSYPVLYLLIINYILAIPNSVCYPFLYGYGLFQDIWAPIIKTLLYIICAVVGGALWGLPGVLLGNTISLLLVYTLWKPYFLFTRGFRLPVYKFWLLWVGLLLLIMFINILSRMALNTLGWLDIYIWKDLIFRSFISLGLYTLLYALVLSLIFSPFRRLMTRFVSLKLK